MNVIELLIESFSKLPGLGRKSASRLVYYLLKADDRFVHTLASQIIELKRSVQSCAICGNYTDVQPCSICTDPSRDMTVLCVVEDPKDVLTIEATHEFRGRYHALMGAISPIDGVGPADLRIASLVQRVRTGGIKEVILATNPTVEGESTALYVVNLLRDTGVVTSRLALGLPMGGDLEFADRQTLTRSLRNRSPL